MNQTTNLLPALRGPAPVLPGSCTPFPSGSESGDSMASASDPLPAQPFPVPRSAFRVPGNPIAQFNAAFGYHFAEQVWYDHHTLQLMAELARHRGQPRLALALLAFRPEGTKIT